ncbi:hypothetical protein RHSIM_Rhsim06G0106200 [Rhododendron simsii]|uniref:Receptor-like serine/threonine-protein kinase n=1 Tax=Rhododendron simsii TaxID=118357 RepID=A0A834GXF5_RHOSS|nr:hypothetical protein RHSIM_Rhsim06G0106200 [Rhododendron simsii]
MEKARADHFHLLPSLADMGSFPLIFSIVLSFSLLASCSPTSTNFIIFPNFTASSVHFIDGSLGFLTSPNKTFKAAILSPGGQGGSGSNYYLCVVHVPSNTITWSANRDAPISTTGIMTLSATGIVITEEDGSLKWSTPTLNSSVSSLQLTETGNLLLVDQSNATLWESFLYPTDTIVIGQNLPVGVFLSSAVSSTDLSVGSYSLSVTASDALLLWQNSTYWKLSMDAAAYTLNSSYRVEYMAMNQSGLYLFGNNGSVVVMHVNVSVSTFGIAKLDYSGQFSVSSLTGTDLTPVLVGPDDKCQIPFICGTLGLCTDYDNILVCSCPSNFHLISSQSQNSTICMPSDGTYSLSNYCNSTDNNNMSNSSFSYLSLGYGIDYFVNHFTGPVKSGVNLSVCEDLCSSECSCLGIFYDNSSDSCYVLQNQLGSVMSSGNNDRVGFIKAIVGPSPSNSGHSLGFPIVAIVLLPLIGFFLLAALGFFLWRRSKSSTTWKLNPNNQADPSLDDLELDAFSIPGLPVRFGYEELEVATDKFKNMIGSGGFGAVYKGTLPDKSLVAVKKITNFGIQGMKDFCAEIAIIGNIHHVNLVKLIGFCAQGSERLLVYEYMNHGSLDHTLFRIGFVLEWKERVAIALGMARGLAYLHSGCQQKIIHCDIKPENILLHDHFQAKISDFGLSKLLSSEQSTLFTTMRGTRGYLAPEWLTGSAISDKTDVYSFGMVLLEIVSGRKNCSLRTQCESKENESSGGGYYSSPSGQGLVYFPMFALEMHEQGRYLELADPKLEGRVTSEDVEKLVRVALCCAHEDPTLRPNMVSVVSMLEGDIPIGEPRLESLNFLRFYGRRFAEASMIEENNGEDDLIFPQWNTSSGSSRSSLLPLNISRMSSQQISGPR